MTLLIALYRYLVAILSFVHEIHPHDGVWPPRSPQWLNTVSEHTLQKLQTMPALHLLKSVQNDRGPKHFVSEKDASLEALRLLYSKPLIWILHYS